MAELIWKAQGDANEYVLLDQPSHWVAAIKVNGEWHVHKQEALMRRIAASAELLELLRHAVDTAELRLASHLADKGVSGATDYWLEPAKALIARLIPEPATVESVLDQGDAPQ